jgi:hypothetical protein
MGALPRHRDAPAALRRDAADRVRAGHPAGAAARAVGGRAGARGSVSAPDTGTAPSLDELRDTLEAIGECVRPLTALNPHDLARQATAAYAHAWRHATRAADDVDADERRGRTRPHLAAALAAARSALLERTAPGTGELVAFDGDDEEGAYRSAAAYAAAAGCVVPADDPAERALTEQLISRLTLAIADLATAHTAAPPALHHD